MKKLSVEVRVGLLILAALVLLGGFVFVLGGVELGDKYELFVDFGNPGNVQPGAPVSVGSIRIGSVEEVVVEGPSKKDPTVTTGRTRRNTLVHFPTATVLRPGSYARVEVTAARVNHLRGELVEVAMPARHRTRIPVSAG